MILLCTAGTGALTWSYTRLVRPTRLERLTSGARHEAFPVLAHWGGRYWLAYRDGAGHGSVDADVVMLSSTDGDHWAVEFRTDVSPNDGPAALLSTPDRLFLYIVSSDDDGGGGLRSLVTFTGDGKTWSRFEPVYDDQYIFYEPVVHNGRFYANAHYKAEGKGAGLERSSHLIVSDDGVHFTKVSAVSSGNWESETAFCFGRGERLFAFLRTKYTEQGSVFEADPPYEKWAQRPANVHLSGHSFQTFNGVTYLFSRVLDPPSRLPGWRGNPTRNHGSMIYTVDDLATARLTPYCRLPSGYDCSYAHAVRAGGEMLVAYYSSHEGSANIYLARVPLKP